MRRRARTVVDAAKRLGAAALVLVLALAPAAGASRAGGDRSSLPQAVVEANRPAPRPATPEVFMMVSAWRLAPYSSYYLQNVLPALARVRVAGIVYSTTGELTDFFARKRTPVTERLYNERIFRMARRWGTPLWLQMRVYANRVDLQGRRTTLTAERLLADPAAYAAFRKRFLQDFNLYNRHFRDGCTVILFEEAGIYHSPQGGGYFWSSRPSRVKRSPAYDEMFASRLARLFARLRAEIRKVNPACRVGMHLGHSVFLNRPVFLKWMRWLQRRGARPDFMFYDFYLKAQPSFEAYRQKLTRRFRLVKEELNWPFFHLAQLHTMNNFQHGGGRTPSREEIDRIVRLDLELGVDGIGFYTKNALPTRVFDNAPLAPNREGQRTLFESARDRWDYGLAHLAAIRGLDFADYFDLAVQGRFGRQGAVIDGWNWRSGRWEVLGRTPPRSGENTQPFVLRMLPRTAFIHSRKGIVRLRVRLPEGVAGRLSQAWILPSQPPETFVFASEMTPDRLERLSMGGLAQTADGPLLLDAARNELMLHVSAGGAQVEDWPQGRRDAKSPEPAARRSGAE